MAKQQVKRTAPAPTARRAAPAPARPTTPAVRQQVRQPTNGQGPTTSPSVSPAGVRRVMMNNTRRPTQTTAPVAQPQGLDAWEAAKQRAKMPRSGTTVPARKLPYTCVLTEAKLVNTTKHGEKIKYTGTVVYDPEYDGKTVEFWSPPLDTQDDQQMDILFRQLFNLGADIDNMTRDDFTQEQLDALVGENPAFECAVVENPSYPQPNVYINKPITLEEGGGLPAADAGTDEQLPEDTGTDEPAADEGEFIDIDSPVNYTPSGGGETRSGTVIRFEGKNSEWAVIRDDETGRPVKIKFENVSLTASE